MHTSCSMVHAGTRTLGAAGTRTLGARRYKNTHWCNCPMTQVQEHSDEGTVRQGDQAACVCYNSPPRMRCVWASLTRIWTGWRVVRGRCQGSGLGSRTTCVRSGCGPKRGVCPVDCLLCSVHGRLPAVKVRKLRWSIFRDEFISRLRQAEFDEVCCASPQ